VKHGDLVDEKEEGMEEELANGLERDGARDSMAVDFRLLRRLAAGMESGAAVHQQSRNTRGGHGESDVAL
jgi:hypothetical protein